MGMDYSAEDRTDYLVSLYKNLGLVCELLEVIEEFHHKRLEETKLSWIFRDVDHV